MPTMLLFGHRCQVVAIITLLASFSAAQFDNPILQPQPGEIIAAGTTYNVIWSPTAGDLVSIELWNGFTIASYFNGSNCVVDEDNPSCSLIVQNIANTGSFLWTIPANAPTSDTYYLDIYVPDPDIDGPYYYMSGNFSILPASSVPTTTTAANSHHTSSVIKPNVIGAATNSTAGTQKASTGLSPGVEGAIIGAVVAVGILIASALLFFLLRARRKSNKKHARVSTIISGRTMSEALVEEEEYEIPDKIHPAQDDGVVGTRIQHEGEDEIAGARLRYLE